MEIGSDGSSDRTQQDAYSLPEVSYCYPDWGFISSLLTLFTDAVAEVYISKSTPAPTAEYESPSLHFLSCSEALFEPID
jgi:hypothetical protein